MQDDRSIGFYGTGPTQLLVVVPSNGLCTFVDPSEYPNIPAYWNIQPANPWDWCVAVQSYEAGKDAILMEWVSPDEWGKPNDPREAPDDWTREKLQNLGPYWREILIRGRPETARRVELLNSLQRINILPRFTMTATGSVEPNQSYLIKEMQYKLAAPFGTIISQIAGTTAFIEDSWDHPKYVVHTPDSWRKDDMHFTYGTHGAYIKFSHARWDPERSKIDYGKKRLAQNVNEQLSGQDQIIKAGADTHVSYEESVELTDSFTTSITKGMTLDVTASASSETTVSGEYMGVKAEEKVAISMGVDVGKSEEESKEQSEEGKTTKSLAIDFDAQAGHNYLVRVAKEHQTTYQDFDIHGMMDFDIYIHMGDKRGKPKNGDAYPHDGKVDLQGFDGFEQWINGYDTDYPEMKDFLDKCFGRTKNAINYLLNKNLRILTCSGTTQGNLDSVATYTVEDLGGDIPDEWAHLPVKDAEEVNDTD